MNVQVDFSTLSCAVQQANNASVGRLASITSEQKHAADMPRKLPLRRRSSKALASKNAAAQFLKAAQRSWTFVQEDLPSGETTALQRRKSIAKNKELQTMTEEIGHKSWTCGIQTEFPLAKEGSSRPLPTHGTTKPRRASFSGSVTSMASPIIEEGGGQESVQEAAARARQPGRLTRRSSMQRLDRRSKPWKEEEKENSAPVRRMKSDPAKAETRRSGWAKTGRRNTIHCSSLDDSSNSLTQSRKQTRKRSSKGNCAAKGTVRFELDHKNRIKRRVTYIRPQNSKTVASALWWSEEDLERIYERENKVYEKYAENQSYKQKIDQLWGHCSRASDCTRNSLSVEAVAHLAGSPSRGLEVDVLETVRDRRARVIGSLLVAQETLRDNDPSIRAMVLSARYKNLCKAATRFAQKMAEGDAIEAANVYHDSN